MKLFGFLRRLFGSNSSDKPTGFIKFYNKSKGYGFIHTDDTPKEVFVHVSELRQKVKVGDKVKFDLDTNQKGFIAKNVEKI